MEALAAKRSIGGGGAAGLGEVLRSNNYQERNIDDYIPSAPTMTSEDAVLAWYGHHSIGGGNCNKIHLSAGGMLTIL